MANIKSAKKRIETNERNRASNKSATTRMKTQIKKFRKAVQEGDIQTAETLLPSTTATIDKTASKGVIHKNAAARRKSTLAKELDKAKQEKTTK